MEFDINKKKATRYKEVKKCLRLKEMSDVLITLFMFNIMKNNNISSVKDDSAIDLL